MNDRTAISGLLRHVASVYRKTCVSTANDNLLFLEMHDAAIACVLSPAPSADNGHPLMRAHALISELQATLDPEHNADLAQVLSSFYDALLSRIVDAFVSDELEPLLSVAAALRELRSAFSQVCAETQGASQHGHA
ncbi:MAG TPA: flagellar protein FliS [Polyangiales bacterium]|nr:flagellar protein FliS [Polyangiales bacterium]